MPILKTFMLILSHVFLHRFTVIPPDEDGSEEGEEEATTENENGENSANDEGAEIAPELKEKAEADKTAIMDGKAKEYEDDDAG